MSEHKNPKWAVLRVKNGYVIMRQHHFDGECLGDTVIAHCADGASLMLLDQILKWEKENKIDNSRNAPVIDDV